MKFKNLSRVERNMLTGLFCQFVTILLGFLMPRLYLTYYGSGVNGELNTITSTMPQIGVSTANNMANKRTRFTIIVARC